MTTEIVKQESFIAQITSDEFLGDLSRIAHAIGIADQIEKMGVTAKLYLIAETINRHGMDAALQVLSSNFGHSDAYCGMLINLVASVGLGMLKEALINSNPLALDQWREIAKAKSGDKERLYDMAVNHNPPALEMRAQVNGLPIEEQRKKDILAKLNSALKQVERFGLREEATEVLANYGYVKKMVVSPGAKR
jgi:hypothetical protein